MAGYPQGEGERRVGEGPLGDVVRAIFAACGMSETDAALLADTLVAADLRGIHSHGTLRVADYVAKLTAEGVDPLGRPRLLREHGAALVVDGNNAMGQIAAAFAMERAIERARSMAVSVAAVGGSNHCGAMDYYAMMAAEAGMIGLATTNALPTMAPWGGSDKSLGINPLAIAMPGEPALVFDGAFSASSHGKIRVFQQKDATLPEGWASDAAGNPTTDPAVAAEGLLRPIGAYKGTDLALMMGLLSTLLSGAAFGAELGNMADGPRPGSDGHFLAAIDIAAFVPAEDFATRLAGIAEGLRAGATAPGHERIHMPGDIERETAAAYARDGIPLTPETVAGIEAMAAKFGVSTGAL
jgi:LDH2 family malate/lactate/ureidoglycolate dehydrogenase